MAMLPMVIFVLFVLESGLKLALARPSTQGVSANEFFYSIDEADREAFLIWQLGIETQRRTLLEPKDQNIPSLRVPKDLKVDHETFSKLRKLQVPPDFSRKLYLWFRGAYGLSPSQIETFITQKRACSKNRCFDVGDVGNNCCPF